MSTSKYKLKKFKIISPIHGSSWRSYSNKYKNKRSAEEPYRWNKLKKMNLNFCTFILSLVCWYYYGYQPKKELKIIIN